MTLDLGFAIVGRAFIRLATDEPPSLHRRPPPPPHDDDDVNLKHF